MSADLNTEITMKGTEEELFSLVKVIQSFETEKYEQYNTKHDCGYIEFCRIIEGEADFSKTQSNGRLNSFKRWHVLLLQRILTAFLPDL